jgi:NADH dehydrogenase FAD-containing subunit
LASAPSGIGNHAQTIIKSKPSIRLINKEMASKKEQQNDKFIYETDRSHTIIEADLVYNCIGVQPNSKFLNSTWLNDKQQVVVDETLKVPHTSNVFAVGDVNSVQEPKMFYTAHMQALHFTKNMKCILNNAARDTLLPYRGCRINMVVSMGPAHAVGHVSGINLTGWPLETKSGSRLAAVTKYFIERITMDDFGLKLPVNDLLYYTQGKRQGHLHSS